MRTTIGVAVLMAGLLVWNGLVLEDLAKQGVNNFTLGHGLIFGCMALIMMIGMMMIRKGWRK